MPYRYSKNFKSREDSPFVGPLTTRPIVVAAGKQWPIGELENYAIPLGVPMAPVGTTGKYAPIRRSQIATSLASNDTYIYVDNARGFATNDIVALFTGAASTTNSGLATITAVDYALNRLTVAALPSAITVIVTDSYCEVNENGYLLAPKDAVFLGENIQTGNTTDGQTWDAPAVGIVKGQVDINRLDTNCYDALIESQISGMDYIPTTSGV